MLSLDDAVGVFSLALQNGVQKTALHKIMASHLHPKHVPTARLSPFNLPRLKESALMSPVDCCRLWSWLPVEQYVLQPRRVFVASTDGYLLSTLLRAVGNDDRPHFIVVQQTSGALCGVFMAQSWRSGAADGRCFPFALKPSPAAYRYTPAADEDDQLRSPSSILLTPTSAPASPQLSTPMFAQPPVFTVDSALALPRQSPLFALLASMPVSLLHEGQTVVALPQTAAVGDFFQLISSVCLFCAP